MDDVLQNGRKFYDWNNEPFIPVEFSVGAYRFGHSQFRPSYRANFGAFDDDGFFGFIFIGAMSPDPDDLRGGKRAQRRFIDWQTFFDFGDGKVRSNKPIDTTLSSVLFDLPDIPADEPQSLAQRNLRRHLALRVPSGQRVARAMGVPRLRERISRICSHTAWIGARRFGSMFCARRRSWPTASGWDRAAAGSWLNSSSACWSVTGRLI